MEPRWDLLSFLFIAPTVGWRKSFPSSLPATIYGGGNRLELLWMSLFAATGGASVVCNFRCKSLGCEAGPVPSTFRAGWRRIPTPAGRGNEKESQDGDVKKRGETKGQFKSNGI